ncbi:MAG: methyltransferase domain-containing protein [Acidobacteria bacterium]|nr:methyltransferase domain-containing protein [Acidobacteriota bacterium]
MPAHWLMARLGKRVLRPGGIETTRWLLEQAAITSQDDVIELAPGLGRTAALILSRQPRSYVGVERDARAAQFTEHALAGRKRAAVRILHADAAAVPLADGSATLLVGEAMLSMQTVATKQNIMREAHRLLRPGGRYVIHELAVTPDDLAPAEVARIQADLSSVIHVGVRIGTVRDWRQWLEQAGFAIERMTMAPMRLLEPARLVRDEGVAGAARFVCNALRTPGAPRRLRAVRGVFRQYRDELCGVGLIARRA